MSLIRTDQSVFSFLFSLPNKIICSSRFRIGSVTDGRWMHCWVDGRIWFGGKGLDSCAQWLIVGDPPGDWYTRPEVEY